MHCCIYLAKQEKYILPGFPDVIKNGFIFLYFHNVKYIYQHTLKDDYGTPRGGLRHSILL